MYELSFDVRDYECDLQGIVNNAVYQQYLEHTRHQYIKSRGIDFSQAHRQGFDLVVVRAELNYRHPLKSGDQFVVTLTARMQGKLRYVFDQSIYLLPERKLVLNAIITTACVNSQGRPVVFPFLDQLL